MLSDDKVRRSGCSGDKSAHPFSLRQREMPRSQSKFRFITKRRNPQVKKKVTLFFLVFALILTCASAMAANIKDASKEGNSNDITVEKESAQAVKVTYKGEKDKEYVVMAVAQSGVDATAGRPTKETIGNNQNGVVVYMDQAKANASGNVEFTVRPNLDQAKANDTYSIYISSNVSDSAMTKVGSFTIEEILTLIGDVNGDDKVNSSDITALVNLVISGNDLTPNQKLAADANGDDKVNSSDITALVNLVISG